MNRLHNLDYLRGLAAFGIMIYHYLTWILGSFPADSVVERIGIYGVSVFYVLSGLTLHYVYFHKMLPSRDQIIDFTKKRILRIFPLLWLVTIVSVLLSRQTPDLVDLGLNLTGLFGFFKWDTYFSVGAWSIGNELVFYVFFPFFILFAKRNKIALAVLSLAIFFLYLYFAFGVLDANKSLNDQWRDYVNPLNQVFLFLGGFLTGLLFQNRKMNNAVSVLLLVAGAGLFVSYPASGDSISLVTGMGRLVFTLSCFLICLGFYKLFITLPALISKPLALLGEASYSVYLLHPLVYKVTGMYCEIFHLAESVKFVLSVLSTLLISFLVYTYFEKYFMKLGRKTKEIPVMQVSKAG